MQLHQIKSDNKRQTKKRIGRGGKRGTFCGRGNKGQLSRAGRRMQPAIREYIKRYPKLRGYKFNTKDKNIVITNISEINKKFDNGELVSPQTLIKKKIISKIKGKIPQVKILGDGKIEKKVIVKDCVLSKVAEDKIKKAGGEIS
ncbi:uL15 family ribosomal protein [Patescibacteria group bacterium]|nr:uL15 family ribosomal protein [Patescibacteria group bacterium]MBU4023115.1 uL15 family ribosomal protein [Patescibacteria group bacterium]MBU4078449.1 uL15 family ribosomal protein [Patescibacteria group bacterium]